MICWDSQLLKQQMLLDPVFSSSSVFPHLACLSSAFSFRKISIMPDRNLSFFFFQSMVLAVMVAVPYDVPINYAADVLAKSKR